MKFIAAKKSDVLEGQQFVLDSPFPFGLPFSMNPDGAWTVKLPSGEAPIKPGEYLLQTGAGQYTVIGGGPFEMVWVWTQQP